MIKKKNRFFTFIFSFLPGAGHMYMGFMNRGVSLMSCFFLIIFASVWLNMGPLMFIVLIVWFYSFFDTHNIRSMPDDEFYELEDKYIVFPEFLKDSSYRELQKKYRNIIAVILIILGFTVLWNNFFDIFSYMLPDEFRNLLYSFGHNLPQLVIGVAIILFGIHLIRGKKQELDDLEE